MPPISSADEAARKMISIYKIDVDEVVSEFAGTTDYVDSIMSTAQASGYLPEELRVDELGGYAIRIFHKWHHPSYEKWLSFFDGCLRNESFLGTTNNSGEVLEPKSGSFVSFVVFLSRGESVFAFCVGKGYLVIDRWAEQYFGFDVVTRLLPPNAKVLRQMTNNALTGTDFETSNIFRSSQSFLSQDDFGKIIKEAVATLGKDAMAKIGIDKGANTNCVAKSHFTLKNGLSLNELTEKILPNIEKVMSIERGFLINQISAVKKNDSKFASLLEALERKMFTNFDEFDFFPPANAIDYFQAAKHVLLNETRIFSTDAEQKDFLTANIHSLSNSGKFEEFTSDLKSKVKALDDDDQPIMDGFSLIRCLNGEFQYEGETYFWLNGKFWKIEGSAIEQFNIRCWQALKEAHYVDENNKVNPSPIPLRPIGRGQLEGAYNDSHKDKFVVLDAKLIDGIEFCDLLYKDANTLYVIHIKRGFNRDMRVLSSQIAVSARILTEFKRGDKDFMNRLSQSVEEKGIIKSQDFLALFEAKNINYVLAFSNEREISSLDDVRSYRSSIAKLELFDTVTTFNRDFSPNLSLRIVGIPLENH